MLPRVACDTAKAELEAGAAGLLGTSALSSLCNEVPVAIKITAAHVNAKIEVLEVIDGVMQAPTGADVVSWYKSSPRLGQPGNMLLAGHLNWWGVPQAVFFYLNTLKPGDLVQVTGQGGEVYTYRVVWNRLEDATKPPTTEVVGPTKVPSLTLITCGGTWIPAASEYDSRTVVRAEFVSVQQPKK